MAFIPRRNERVIVLGAFACFFFEKNLLPLHIKWRAGKGKQVLYDKRGSI